MALAVVATLCFVMGGTHIKSELNPNVARGVVDGSIDSDALTTTDSLSIFAPTLSVWSDTMYLNHAWCGVDTIPCANNPETVFVSCPIVGDSLNTIIMITTYFPYSQDASPQKCFKWVRHVSPDSGFWVESQSRSDYGDNWFYWIAYRRREP